MDRLSPKTTALIVVDVQERLASAMPEPQLRDLLRATRILIEAARRLGAPLFNTEQYPKGLGPTLPEVAVLLEHAGAQRFVKTEFSACDADGFGSALEASGARAAVVVGMESHVCVYQTVRDLVRRGIEAYVPIDGVASRRDDHREAGLALSERAGAVRTTAESVVFDWLRESSSPEFKEISKLVKGA
jgi:nicotinamidase-related amidase